MPCAHAQPLPHAVPEHEPRIEHRHDRPLARHELPVDPDQDPLVARVVLEVMGAMRHGAGTLRAPTIGRMSWQIYLSGEIHTDWRDRIERGTAAAGLDLRFTAPVTDHAASDAAGTAILGEQERPFWNDHIGAGVNAIRTRTLIERAAIVVVRFGEQYRQWNAAFDAGYAAALGKPLITLHPPEHDHALKEVDRAALAVAREPEQVVEILRYALDDEAQTEARPRVRRKVE